MFLYWKKRGTYELEALPSALAALELGAVERFSWSSTLDIIEDLGGRCGPFPRAVGRLPQLVCLAASLWPVPVARSPCTCHSQVSCSAVVWGPEPPLRALAGGGEGPQHEDPEGLCPPGPRPRPEMFLFKAPGRVSFLP